MWKYLTTVGILFLSIMVFTLCIFCIEEAHHAGNTSSYEDNLK